MSREPFPLCFFLILHPGALWHKGGMPLGMHASCCWTVALSYLRPFQKHDVCTRSPLCLVFGLCFLWLSAHLNFLVSVSRSDTQRLDVWWCVEHTSGLKVYFRKHFQKSSIIKTKVTIDQIYGYVYMHYKYYKYCSAICLQHVYHNYTWVLWAEHKRATLNCSLNQMHSQIVKFCHWYI